MNQPIQRGKRLIDLLLAVPAFVLFLPVMLVVWVVVAAGLGRPVIFRQRRPGLRGKAFTVLKFRTMTDARDGEGNLKPDIERLTQIGRFLRKSSLDELPQLWNVVAGEMSLVGPRPLLMDYLPHYTPEQQRRHDVMPGITGWAQINGRNVATFSERLKLDVWYVDHWSLWLDARILWRTLAKVLRSSGVRLEQTLDEIDDIGLHPKTRKKAALAAQMSARAAAVDSKEL